LNVIILAGGRMADDFKLASGVEAKALIPLLGRPMVEYSIEAARGCTGVQQVCVVAGEWFLRLAAATRVEHYVPDHGHEVDNLFAALDTLGSDDPTLMLTADTPLITPALLEAFLASLPPEADVGYSFVERERILERFADRRGRSGTTRDAWVFVRLAEGQFTGSSLVYFRPEALRRNEPLLRQVMDARRQAWRLALLIGPLLILRAVLQQLLPTSILSWRDIERRMGELAGCNCVGLVSDQPELAFDVDYPTDIELAGRELRAQGWQEADAAG